MSKYQQKVQLSTTTNSGGLSDPSKASRQNAMIFFREADSHSANSQNKVLRPNRHIFQTEQQTKGSRRYSDYQSAYLRASEKNLGRQLNRQNTLMLQKKSKMPNQHKSIQIEVRKSVDFNGANKLKTNMHEDGYTNTDEYMEQLQIEKNKRIRQIYNPQSSHHTKINPFRPQPIKNSKSPSKQTLEPANKNKSISWLRNKNKSKAINLGKFKTEQVVENNNPFSDRQGNSHYKSHVKNKDVKQNSMMVMINGNLNALPTAKSKSNKYINSSVMNNNSGNIKILPVTFQKIEKLQTIKQTKKNQPLRKKSLDEEISKRASTLNLSTAHQLRIKNESPQSVTSASQEHLPFPKFNSFFETYCHENPNNRVKQSKTSLFQKIKAIKTENTPLRSVSIIQNHNSMTQITNEDSNINKSKLKQLQIFENMDIASLKIIKSQQGVYYGEVDQNNIKNGKGAIFYHNGKLYQGEFKNDNKQGKGIETFPDGSSYKGQFQKGKRNGKGRFQWPNGQIYDGQWLDNYKHGSGLWENKDSTATYLGQWAHGSISGFGVLTNEKGQRYQGQFLNFNKEGHGAYRFQNGDRIIGNFRKNQPNGDCQYFWANGGNFKGQFSNGLRHGYGVQKYIDGSLFEGEFRNDKKCGLGKETYTDGIVYFGNYQNDLRHGYGKLTFQEHIYYQGYWLNNVAVIFQEKQQGFNQIVEDEKERLGSNFSNRLSTEKLKKLPKQDQQKILKSMRSKQTSPKKPKIQKFSSKNLLQRLCGPRKRCRCLVKH